MGLVGLIPLWVETRNLPAISRRAAPPIVRQNMRCGWVYLLRKGILSISDGLQRLQFTAGSSVQGFRGYYFESDVDGHSRPLEENPDWARPHCDAESGLDIIPGSGRNHPKHAVDGCDRTRALRSGRLEVHFHSLEAQPALLRHDSEDGRNAPGQRQHGKL